MIIGHGIDIVHIERFRKLLAKNDGHFIERVFNESEREYCDSRADPAPHYAARFAVKEAFGKATGLGLVRSADFHDVSVTHDAAGKPGLNLISRAAETCKDLGVTQTHISISHDGDLAIASVLLEKL